VSQPSEKTSFLIGNVIMASCVVMLFYMDTLWQHLGAGALALWMVSAGAGAYFLMKDKGANMKVPD
jgi:hypothetical protein